MVPPGVTRRPAIQPRCERGLRVGIGVVAEPRGKSPARGGLRGCGVLRGGRRRSELLLPRKIALLHPLLARQRPLLGLKRALRPAALRPLRLQLLHALLQPIDPALAFGGLARQRVALALLHELLTLLDSLLAGLRAIRDPLLAWRTRAGRWRAAVALRRGDARRRA